MCRRCPDPRQKPGSPAPDAGAAALKRLSRDALATSPARGFTKEKGGWLDPVDPDCCSVRMLIDNVVWRVAFVRDGRGGTAIMLEEASRADARTTEMFEDMLRRASA